MFGGDERRASGFRGVALSTTKLKRLLWYRERERERERERDPNLYFDFCFRNLKLKKEKGHQSSLKLSENARREKHVRFFPDRKATEI